MKVDLLTNGMGGLTALFFQNRRLKVLVEVCPCKTAFGRIFVVVGDTRRLGFLVVYLYLTMLNWGHGLF